MANNIDPFPWENHNSKESGQSLSRNFEQFELNNFESGTKNTKLCKLPKIIDYYR